MDSIRLMLWLDGLACGMKKNGASDFRAVAHFRIKVFPLASLHSFSFSEGRGFH